jgi:hypothetical protein
MTPRYKFPLAALEEMNIVVGSEHRSRLAEELPKGTAEVVVVNGRGDESYFPVPPLGTGPPIPTITE